MVRPFDDFRRSEILMGPTKNNEILFFFQIGELGPGKYNLTAQGSGSLRFFNTTELEFVEKSHSVFIQTDKAIYKPGHMVHFRIIVVNPQLKPSVTGSLDIHMTVGGGNLVAIRRSNRFIKWLLSTWFCTEFIEEFMAGTKFGSKRTGMKDLDRKRGVG